MRLRTLLSVLFLLIPFVSILAQEPLSGPTIEGYGPNFPLQQGDVGLHKDDTFRVVFDVARYPGGDTASLNEELNTVARFVNMHTRSGIPLTNLDIAVVLHGEALKSALLESAYVRRFDTANPNIELLFKLHDAGVRFFACGQSLGFRKIGREELASPVKVGLSAMTLLATMQSDGYVLLP